MKDKKIVKAVKKLKKLGLHHLLHYNNYTKKWSVFKNGEWSPTSGVEGINGTSKCPLKAVKKYKKNFKKA
jgi:hypothetical protein